jgi:peptidoglycan/LPS O-acetylase OafA/YrhL
MLDRTERRTRKWADVVAILASVVALANAMWGPIIFTTMADKLSLGDRGIDYNWMAFGLGGILGLCGIIVAQRWPQYGRIPLALGGLMLVIVPFFYEHKVALPIATSVVLGLAMLAAAPFIGQLPAPSRRPETAR